MSASSTPAIIVHGGAGAWRLSSAALREATQACAAAAEEGRAVLVAGGRALDAVEAAVRLLEDCPLLNAGRGSLATTAGTIELDAMIMEGRTLDIGAVAAVQRVLNPVSLARAVMERSPHALLVAAGAGSFAEAIGFPCCVDADLVVERPQRTASDTVGAVALDAAGDLAAATSTGGVPGKWPGRVGDSPLAGCGVYADNARAAVSATGDGEALMKLTISALVCQLVDSDASPQAACDEALAHLAARFSAQGGLIALDANGRIGIACNTVAMPVAYAAGKAPVVASERPREVP